MITCSRDSPRLLPGVNKTLRPGSSLDGSHLSFGVCANLQQVLRSFNQSALLGSVPSIDPEPCGVR